MAEVQEIRDKEMRGIRSSNRYFNRVNKDRIDKIKRVEDIIRDLESHGPAGLIHIGILSNIIGKPIRIWNAIGSLNRIIGKRKIGQPIDVEYHKTDLEQIGHWTLKYGKDPDNISIDLNNCLFSVIGSQIGQNPSELRKWTVQKLKTNLRRLANRIDEIVRLEKNGKIILMIGGARYCGTSAEDAKIILDNSEMHPRGHPRGHASHPSVPNVEFYSLGDRKTAFLSREDQNYVTHLALITNQARSAMNELNRGGDRMVINVKPKEMRNERDLPKVKEYVNGVPRGTEQDFEKVTIVLEHHAGQKKNPDADVFILTCYPVLIPGAQPSASTTVSPHVEVEAELE